MVESTDDQKDVMQFYMGNPHLKAANVKLSYTQDQLEEYIRCSSDPFYFIEKYVKIVTIDEGLVPFKLWDFQKNLIQNFIQNRYTIAKLPRQVGKSTTTVSYLLWVVLFQPTQNVAILANKSATAREILGRLQTSYENIPLWLQQGVKSWNKGSLELENNSKILAASTSDSSVRGNTYNIIFLDEFAFVPHNIAEEFMSSVYPTITSGKTSKVIMVSTPKGMNLFYKYWTEAINKRNLYIPIEIHWSNVPGRDKQWAEDQVKQLGQEQFDQEFGCVAGDTIIETINGKMTIENLFLMHEEIYVVYKIVRDDGKIYIGTTKKDTIEKRMVAHSKTKRFKNHTFDYFILEESTSKDYIDNKEEYYIKFFDSYRNGLNESLNGKGNHHSKNFTTLGYKFSEQSKRKMSKSAKERIQRNGPIKQYFTKKSLNKIAEKASKRCKGKIASYKIDTKIYNALRQKFNIFKPFFIPYVAKNGKIVTAERAFAIQNKNVFNISIPQIINILQYKTLR